MVLNFTRGHSTIGSLSGFRQRPPGDALRRQTHPHFPGEEPWSRVQGTTVRRMSVDQVIVDSQRSVTSNGWSITYIVC